MALAKNIAVSRRGPRRGDSFVYPAAPNEVIYTGGLFGVNAAGQAVRIQTSGIVAFVGIADNGVNNVGNAAAGPNVVGLNDTYALTVPGATFANINQPVYATDDNTLTLTAPSTGFEGKIGWLVGIENGQTYVEVKGH
jgi:hypothetical protein